MLTGPHLLRSIHHKENGIHFPQCAFGGFHHIFPELVLGLMNPRRVQKDNLGIRLGQDAQNTVPCCLGLVAHDGDFLSDKGID